MTVLLAGEGSPGLRKMDVERSLLPGVGQRSIGCRGDRPEEGEDDGLMESETLDLEDDFAREAEQEQDFRPRDRREAHSSLSG